MATANKETAPASKKKRPLLGRLGKLVAIQKAPTWWAVALTVADSAATVFNQTTLPKLIGYGATIQLGITLLLGLCAFYGIGPVLGTKFKAYVHLPAKVAGAIGMVLLVGEIAVQREAGTVAAAIVLGLIQFAGGLGFAPAYIPTV